MREARVRSGDVRWVTGLIQRKRYILRINFCTFVTFKLKFSSIYSKYTGKRSTSPPLPARLAVDCSHTHVLSCFLSLLCPETDRPAAGSPLRPERQGGVSSSSFSLFSPHYILHHHLCWLHFSARHSFLPLFFLSESYVFVCLFQSDGLLSLTCLCHCSKLQSLSPSLYKPLPCSCCCPILYISPLQSYLCAPSSDDLIQTRPT